MLPQLKTDEAAANVSLADDLSSSQQREIIAVVKWYSEQLEAGASPDRQAVLEQHPSLASQLTSYFDGLEFLHRAARPIVGEVHVEDPASLADPLAGTHGVLGEFRIVRELGRGGMGIVYEAIQLPLGRRVALKILPFASMLPANHLRRFEREAAAVARLNHPRIVTLYTVGCERGVHYYAMQLIEGQTLAQFIADLSDERNQQHETPEANDSQVRRDNSRSTDSTAKSTATSGMLIPDRSTIDTRRTSFPLHPTSTGEFFIQVARLAIQAAEALEHSHAQGIVHRDIKPSNLLVNTSGELWISDFGLARTSDSENLTQSGEMVGTLRYMSPEQAAGHRNELDHRTDIYSLGATLYELITMRPPFTSDDPAKLLQEIADRDPPPLRHLNASVPRDLETIVLKMLAKRPRDRYETARELTNDLRRFRDNRPVWARRTSWLFRAWKCARRHTATTVLGTALALAISIGAVVSTRYGLQWQTEKDAHHQAQDVSRRSSYSLQLNQIHQLQRRQPEKAIELLRNDNVCPPDLRDFAWGHLNWLSHRVRVTLRGHQGPVCDVKFTPSGNQLVTAGADGTIRQWNPETGELERTIRAHENLVSAIAISPDSVGNLIASVGDDHQIKLWGGDPGQELKSIVIDTCAVDSLSFLSDGTSLVSELNGDFIVWHSDGQEMVESYQRAQRHHLLCSGRDRVSASPDGSLQVVATQYELMILDRRQLSSGEFEITSQEPIHVHLASAVALAPKRRYVAVGGGYVPLRILDIDKRAWIVETPETRESVNSIKISSDEHRIVIGTQTGRVLIYQFDGRSLEIVFEASHPGPVERVEFSPDGQRLAVAGFDGTINIWDLQPDRRIDQVAVHSEGVSVVQIAPSGEYFATGDEQGSIRLWHVGSGRSIGEMKGHEGDILWLAFSPTDKSLASAGYDGTVRIWDLENQMPVAVLRGHHDRVYGVTFSPDGRTIASAGRDSTIRLWDSSTHSERKVLSGHTDCVWFVCYSPDGTEIASAGKDHTVRLWNAMTGTQLVVMDGHSDGVSALSYSPDGKWLASCGVENDATVCIWDVKTRKLVNQLVGHEGAVYSVKFSPDGKTLASSGQDKAVRLWDPVAGIERAILHGHNDWVPSLDFSLRDPLLVSGSSDGTVRLWKTFDLEAGYHPSKSMTPLHRTATEQPDRIYGMPSESQVPIIKSQELARSIDLADGTRRLVFSRNGEILYAGLKNGALLSFSVPTGAVVGEFGRVGGNLVDMAVSADDRRLAAVGSDGIVGAWDIESGRKLSEPRTEKPVHGLQYSPTDGALMMIGDSPPFIAPDTPDKVHVSDDFGNHELPRFSRDAKQLFVTRYSKGLSIVDPITRRITHELRPLSRVSSFAVSPDGKWLACGVDIDLRRVLTIWDTHTGRRMAILHGHTEPVIGLTFTNQNELISMSLDGTIRWWEAGTCQLTGMMIADGGNCHSLALSPDNKVLAAGGGTQPKIWLWNMSTIRTRLKSMK